MAGIVLEKGKIIYTAGQPLTALHMITEGKVAVTYPGGSYTLSKGDIIGVCEICSDVHFLGYTVLEEASLITYSFKDISTLDDLFASHKDIARLFVISAFRQINTLLQKCSLSEPDCSNYYQTLKSDYSKYIYLANRYRVTPRLLDDWDKIDAYLGDESADLWLASFYIGLAKIYASNNYELLVSDAAIPSGFLRKCSLDFRKTYYTLEEHHHYKQQIIDCYFSQDSNDLFDFYTSLYYKLDANCADSNELYTDINRIILMFGKDASIDIDKLDERIENFQNNVASVYTLDEASASASEDSEALNELVDSLNTILDFAGDAFGNAASFRQHIQDYKHMGDKFSTEDDCTALRASLTQNFCVLYSILFKRTLEVAMVPIPVIMFLYFGYVDETLAGKTNAIALAALARQMADHSEDGLYTFYDWLLAIYMGKKEPSRNEFDQDYSDFLHKQKLSGELNDAQFKQLEQDTMAKVDFELKNVFPIANKITYGRISTYCPIFIAENVIKPLDTSIVTYSEVCRIIEHIRSIDYSAFYREGFDMENISALGKELFHFEYLPDIILMPNAGIRGSMWQEIEGKRRNSPGRMLLSIFHMEDLELSIIRMTGEFRWELCKRMQGSRWNDVSDRSLTSEYFDYVQFYRKNRDLTPDAKEKIRTSLQRAKNSFKEMFVRDYIVWIMFESNGSPRLNRIARRILFSYCPFPVSIREKVKNNPLYTEILDSHSIHMQQRLHRLESIKKKLISSGKQIPEILEHEIKFVEGML